MEAGEAGRKYPSRTVLTGRSLVIARVVWLSVATGTISLFLAALPTRYMALVSTIDNLTPAQQLVLADLGISGLQQAHLVFAVEVLVAIVFFGVAFLIFSRRSNDWLALLISLAQITYIAWADPPLKTLAVSYPAWLIPVTLIQIAGMISSIADLLLFPTGRFVPRWSKLVLLGSAGWGIAWLLWPTSALGMGDIYHLPLPMFGAGLACYVSGIAFQIYRYSRETTADQRRQTKLVVVGTAMAALAYAAFGFDRFAVPVVTGPSLASIVYDLIGVPIFLLFATLIPAALAVSILRYRLMEIEVIVNRALTYGALTAFVAGMFPASLTMMNRIFVELTGEKSDLVTIVVTLIFAASLTPLIKLLGKVVDRTAKPAPDPMTSLVDLTHRAQALIEVLDLDWVLRRALDGAIGSFDATGGAVYLTNRRTAEPHYSHGEWTQLGGITAEIGDQSRQYGWIVLGPRRNGHAYHLRDQEVLVEICRGLAHVVRLDQMIGFGLKENPPDSA